MQLSGIILSAVQTVEIIFRVQSGPAHADLYRTLAECSVNSRQNGHYIHTVATAHTLTVIT